MAVIVMADDGIAFDGLVAERQPLGGAESAFVGLAEALAARGHRVTAFTNCAAALLHRGVQWQPIAATPLPLSADLYIANRGDKLLLRVPQARKTVFWIHNPAGYLLKLRYLWKLAWRRPIIVFSGDYHASTYAVWAPSGGRHEIPYGISEIFRTTPPADSPPSPRAIFTSNPMRSLDWLLELWKERIFPRVPAAELHVFSGTATYGAMGDAKAAAMNAVLDRARALRGCGVILHAPVPKEFLVKEMAGARAYLYRGDASETYCASAGEAQAMGVPGVVQDIGSMRERIADGKTGFVVKDEPQFAAAAIRLLTDDALWSAQHAAALDSQRHYGWKDAAAEFEKLL
jgi:glycosyltransferase involved in cell wall biosynthesis